MRTIIAGSRTITDKNTVYNAISEAEWEITQIVSGACRGVDKIGEEWANENGISIKLYPADWNMGKKAGPIRNREMAMNADALVAIIKDNSKGTKSMIDLAHTYGLKVYVKEVE